MTTNNRFLVHVVSSNQCHLLSAVSQCIHEMGIDFDEIDQTTFHGLLCFSAVVKLSSEEEQKTLDDKLQIVAKKFKATIKIEESSIENVFPVRNQLILTLIGETIDFQALSKLDQLLNHDEIQVEHICQLDHVDTNAIEFSINHEEAINQEKLLLQLLDFQSEYSIDFALQSVSYFRRAKRLIVFDADMTFIQCEVIDEIGKAAGVEKEIATITSQAMNGEIDFRESLFQRVKLLKGVPVSALEEIAKRIPFTKGLEKLIQVLQRLGYKIGILSGGFTFFIKEFKEKFNLDYGYANTLEIQDGKLTGNLVGRVIDAQAKADLLTEIAEKEDLVPEQIIAVGDGANDLLMLGKAGLGISFNAKKIVQEQTKATLNRPNLDAILYFLGISGQEIEELLTANS
ncbi:MAG: phosphoserine phosphatase [bacterium]|jgi:phosphoserine phosphatase